MAQKILKKAQELTKEIESLSATLSKLENGKVESIKIVYTQVSDTIIRDDEVFDIAVQFLKTKYKKQLDELTKQYEEL